MSEYERASGILTKIGGGTKESLNFICEQIFKTKFPMDDYEDWKDFIISKDYESYTIVNNILYKIEELEVTDDLDLFSIYKISDNKYKFDTLFYNGSCELHEAIERAVRRWSNE